MPKARTILVFDVDGTLTPARQGISSKMATFLAEVRKRYPLAVVGGSDLKKIVEQLGESKELVLSQFDYVFSENGLVGFKGVEAYPENSILKHLGEEKLQELINFTLHYFSTVKLPVKRGNFIEFRTGMLNLSPIGRSCSQAERDAFVIYDNEHGVREKFVKALEERFQGYGLTFAIGGQISVDAFPCGWDKTYCLQYLTPDYDHIHFFGDKTMPGGNDHAIYADSRTIGHSVHDPDDTITKVQQVVEELSKEPEVC